MVTINCPETGRENYLSNEDVLKLSDCILAQLANYNKAMDLCPEANVLDQIKMVKSELQRINTTLLRLLPEDL